MVDQFRKYSIFILALVVALLCRLFLIAVYKIPTDSMNPTFLSGDIIFASQISYGLKFPWSDQVWFKSSPKKGDLIVFSFKNKASISYIKRVAAVEGDQVETEKGPVKVGPGEVFVLSDNRQILEDSREFGMVSTERIESQAKLIWLSISPSNQIRWDRFLTFVK